MYNAWDIIDVNLFAIIFINKQFYINNDLSYIGQIIILVIKKFNKIIKKMLKNYYNHG